MSINFSFIIPHKNSFTTLSRCIESIPIGPDIEIIVVDDDSDLNFDHDDLFQKLKFQGVNIIQTDKSGGAGYARNIGINNASGKWLLFADADDYYSDSIFELLKLVRSIDSVDVVYFNAVTDSVRFKRTDRLNYFFYRYSIGDLSSLEDIKYSFFAPWNKIFLRDYIVFNSIRFQEVQAVNDARFALFSGNLSDRNIFIDIKAYIHTNNSNGISYSKKTLDQEISSLRVKICILKFLISKGIINDFYKSLFSISKLRIVYNIYGFYGMSKYIYFLFVFFISSKVKFVN